MAWSWSRTRNVLAAATAAGALAACGATAGGTGDAKPAGEASAGPPRTGAVTPAGAAESPSGASCQAYHFTVRQSPSGDPHQVYGELCARGEVTEDTPVQVLLHGGAYDHSYWDWPYKPEKYSYVRHATQAGFATLNLDRLGYGRSDRPDPERLGFEAGAEVVHQVVRYLRDGALGPRFRTVVLNGHSMGGLVAERAAAHGGVDAVIISGIGPDVGGDAEDEEDEAGGPAGEGPGGASGQGDPYYPFHPATQDPKFADASWAKGYYTTRPGTRPAIFLAEGTYEQPVAGYEESLKDTLTAAELRAVRGGPDDEDDPGERGERGGSRREATESAAPRVPTLYALGRKDLIACARTRDCAAIPGMRDAAYLVPRSGHSINVSKGAPDFFRHTISWLAGQGIS
jgi:Lysophospholipase